MPRVAWFAAAFGLGLLQAAAFWPLDHWLAALLPAAGLFALIHRRAACGGGARAAAALAFAFGLGWFGGGLAWLFVSMHTYGGMPAPMAAAAVVLFAGYLSLYPAAATAVAWALCGGRAFGATSAALAGSWTLAEIARGWVFTGFPWLSPGYAQLDGPLAHLAPWAGVFAVGGAAIGVSALLGGAIAALVAARRREAGRLLATAAITLGAAAAVPHAGWTRPHGEPLTVRLVQGNVPQDMKFRADRVVAAMSAYAAEFEASQATLTVLPETAWTVPWPHTPAPIAQRVLAHVARGHALAIGMPLPAAGRDDGRLANSVLLLEPGRAADPSRPATRYDKQHLVPFGEFVPWGFGWFVRMMQIPLGEFARGDAAQPPFEVGGQRIAFNVCYEDLFGEEIRRALDGERGATVLANVSNIAWFGRSHALPQHLAIARMRSLETGRPMLRATNTGVTAAIDGDGRVIAALAPHVAGSLDVRIQGTDGLTPFARAGNTPAIAAALLLVAAAGLATRSRAGSRGQTG